MAPIPNLPAGLSINAKITPAYGAVLTPAALAFFVALARKFEPIRQSLLAARASRQNVVVVQQDTKRVGLVVDKLHGATQTVIKPLAHLFKDVPGVSSTAILGSGRVAFILDVPALLRSFALETADTG